jgi:UDP-glucose 4-epimerase
VTVGRALITGAGGFVGSALAGGFLRLGWQVCALDTTFDVPARARLSEAELVCADLGGPLPELSRADVIIHAAALTTGPEALGITPAEHLRRNMLPLLAALGLAEAMAPRAFVFLSSTGVFAAGDGDADLTDRSEPSGSGPYAAAKRAGEIVVPAVLGAATAPHVLRLGHICGLAEASRPTRARVSPMAEMVAAARAGEAVPLASTDPLRDWTAAEDLAPAMVRLLAAPPAGRVLHFGSPHRMTDSAMAARIAARIPGLRIETRPAATPKAPMRPSTVAALEGFSWTRPEEVIDALCAARLAA